MKKAFAIVLLLAVLTCGLVAQQQYVRVDRRMLGTEGIVGGHSPHGSADWLDLGEGVFSVAQNVTPLDAQPGALLTRRSVSRADSLRRNFDNGEDDDVAARTVGFSYLQQARSVANVEKGAFLFMVDGVALDSLYWYQEYNESDRYDFSTYSLAGGFTAPTVWPNYEGVLEPGTGGWYQSYAFPRIWMSGGLVRNSSASTNFDTGGPASCYFEYIKKLAGFDGGYEGVFYRPVAATDIDWADGYQIVPEKPWTLLGTGLGNDAVVDVYKVLYNGYDFELNTWDISGECYWGNYTYYYCPVDNDGSVGPPLTSEKVYIGIGDEETDGTYTYYARGISLVHEFYPVDEAELRPSIRAIRVYGVYQNPDPLNSYWTNEAEFDLDLPPVNKTGIVGEIDFNGRQFDMSAGQAAPSQGGSSVGYTRSARFNYFTQVGRDGWVAAYKTSTTTFTVHKNIVKRGRFTPGVRLVSGTPVTTDSVFVEIDGYGGVWYTEDWQSSMALETITVDATLPGGWTIGTWKLIRFCFPWRLDGSENYGSLLWDGGPDNWIDADLPFPDGSNANYDDGYPFYEWSCENPAGDRRLAWSYTDRAIYDSGWDIKNVRNVLLYTTNAPDGVMDTKRFPLAVPISGEITGAAFIDDEQFIVSTRDWSQYGRFILSNNQWIVEMGRRLEYGNSARNLVLFNETVYGLDQRYGLWAVGYDASRIRTDISAVGDQRLLFNSMQADWFYRTFGLDSFRLVEATIVVTGEAISVYLPEMANTSSAVRGDEPSGANNFRRFEPGTGASYEHSWLSLYRDGSGFLSYEFAKGGSDYLAVFDPTVGPHGQVTWHTMLDESTTGGFYVGNKSRVLPLDALKGDDYNVLTAIEFGVPVPQFPTEMMKLQMIYARVGAKGDTIQQIIPSVTLGGVGANEFELWAAPRNDVMARLNVNGSNLTQYTNFSVSGTTVSSIGGAISSTDSVVATYYADVDYDVTITPVKLGAERDTLYRTDNVREGILRTDYNSWGEYFKVLVFNNSVEPLLLRGMMFYLGTPREESGTLTSTAITDTTGYGVYETTVPILE